ncbi:hypothetical protein ACFSYD_12340 [Paracoccus aerius]
MQKQDVDTGLAHTQLQTTQELKGAFMPTLFDPLQIGPLTLRNRIVMAP